MKKNVLEMPNKNSNKNSLVLTIDEFAKLNLDSYLPPEEVIKFLQNAITTIMFQTFQKSNIIKPG